MRCKSNCSQFVPGSAWIPISPWNNKTKQSLKWRFDLKLPFSGQWKAKEKLRCREWSMVSGPLLRRIRYENRRMARLLEGGSSWQKQKLEAECAESEHGKKMGGKGYEKIRGKSVTGASERSQRAVDACTRRSLSRNVLLRPQTI